MKNYYLTLVTLLGVLTSGISQNALDTLHAKSELDEVIISGSKFGEHNRKLAANVRVIPAKDFSRLNTSNMANLLETSGQVFVQKSQQGGGSPVIRGFEANRILLVVDGVRMNNAIYRGGHLQNIITIDPNTLERLEVVYGPSSTLFGSDALGGVVNMFTKDPILSNSNKTVYQFNNQLRYSSAIDEKMFHGDLNIGGKNWASFTSATYSNFGDITIGKKEDKDYPDFGLKSFYVKRINGKDSVFSKSDSTNISPSKYNQVDVIQKLLFKPSAAISHLLNLQVSQSSDIPRVDRLSEVSNNLPRFAEWYYGPQKRYMGSYKFERKVTTAFFQEFRIIASHQYVEESRFDRRLNQQVRNERIEKVNVSAITVDARRKMDKHELSIGLEGQLNNLKSTARGFNVDDQSIKAITTRYPDGNNAMSFVAGYVQHLYKISPRFTLNDGLRLTYTNLNSSFVDVSLTKFPFSSASQHHLALNGNVGLVYSLENNLKVSAVLSSGFRAPNFDDLSKVFDSKAGSVVVPNSTLKPEYSYNAELNVVKYFSINGKPNALSIGGSVFHTWMRDAIVVDKFTWLGKDSVDYSGVKSAVLASQNKATADIWGWNAFASLNVYKHFFIDGNVTLTKGKYHQNGADVPLDHIAPLFGKAAVRFDNNKIAAEVNIMFNGWKRLADYSPSGEDNLQYATLDGMPSWNIVNARMNYKVNKTFVFQLALENMLDTRYRTFSSGVSAAGRNFVIAIKTML